MTEISKDKVVQKLAEMFEEEWYTNKSEYQDDDGNETKEFKELEEIETVVNKMIIKYYDRVWNPRILQPIKAQARGRKHDWQKLFHLRYKGKNGKVSKVL